MAKALIGYLSNDRRSTDRLAADNARLRARIGIEPDWRRVCREWA